MAPNDPCHLAFMSWCIPLSYRIKLTCVTNRILWKWQMWLLRLGYKRHCSFSLALSWITHLGGGVEGASCPITGLPKLPYQVTHRLGTEASCQQPWEWAVLETDPPSQAPRWWKPRSTPWLCLQDKSWTRTTQLSCFWILHPQNYEIINIYLFKATKFGGQRVTRWQRNNTETYQVLAHLLDNRRPHEKGYSPVKL